MNNMNTIMQDIVVYTMEALAAWYGFPVYDEVSMRDILSDTFDGCMKYDVDSYDSMSMYIRDKGTKDVEYLVIELLNNARDEQQELEEKKGFGTMSYEKRLKNDEYSKLVSVKFFCVKALERISSYEHE